MTFSSSCRAGFLALVLIVGGVASAQNAPKPAPQPMRPPALPKRPPQIKLPANVAARVGTQDITRDEVLAYLNMIRGRGVTDQVVLSNLLRQEAKAQNITVTEAELKKGIKEVQERIVARSMQTMGAPRTFPEIAAEEGFTDEYVRWNVYMDLLRQRIFAKVAAKEIPPMDNQVRLAHILVATIPLPSATEETPKPLTPEEIKKKDEDAKAQAESILADIKANKISFADAASKFSADKENSTRGGDLGFLPPGRLDPEFEKAGFGIEKVGDIVGPIKTNFGYHLIKLVAKGKDAAPAEKEAYKQRMINQVINNPQMQQRWIESLRTKRPINVNRAVVLVPNAKPLMPAKLPSAPAPKKK